MGFWPYFLHAHESEGGVQSPLNRDPSTSLIGNVTTFFCIARLLLNIHVSYYAASGGARKFLDSK